MFKLLLVFGLYIYAQAVPTQSKSAALIAEANNEFGFNMYKKLAESSQGNILFSPLSAQTVLALTYMGAEGKTAQEMGATLKLPADKALVGQGFQEIETRLKDNKNPNVTMNTANKIYPALDVKVKDGFLQIAKNQFNSDVERLDFSKNDVAANTINGWVEEKTNHKIKNLIKPDSLSGLTRMVLVNALYFNGMWKHQFKFDGDMVFHRSEKPDDVQNVPSMHIENDFMYGEDEDLDAQLLALPYDNTDYNLLIILPRKINGLANVEKQMPFKLSEILNTLQPLKVAVRMPKFKIEQTINVKENLQKLGMQDAFADTANFKGMTDEPVYISEVVQKTFMEVNEKGTEAAAATAVYYDRIFSSTHIMNIDKPFMFLLYKRSTGVILFIGRYSNNNNKNNDNSNNIDTNFVINSNPQKFDVKYNENKIPPYSLRDKLIFFK